MPQVISLLLIALCTTLAQASFYSERPCRLIHLLLTQPASQQAMRIYADHLEMNGQLVHAEWIRLSLAVDEMKKIRPSNPEMIRDIEATQQAFLTKHGGLDAMAKKHFRPLDLISPYDLDLSRNFVRFDLSPQRPATFTMGDQGNGSAHQVTLTEPFEISRTLVTQLEYTMVTGKAPYEFKDRGTLLAQGLVIDPFRPAETVSWEDVEVMIAELNRREQGKAKPYRYFLPTEAQWEYAARAGSQTAFHFGDDEAQLPEYAWFSGGSSGRTMPVGQLKPNANGMFDTAGNVWEWVADWKGNYPSSAVRDPKGPDEGEYRVCRGGSWRYNPVNCRTSLRFVNRPDDRHGSLGFRLARTPAYP
jgi:hypothetical protein